MGDPVYIEPAGDDDEYEYEDSLVTDDKEGHHWQQTRKHSSNNQTISQSTGSSKGIDVSDPSYIRLNGLLPNVTKNEGELLRLKCAVVGQSPIEFRWYKNDAPLLKEKNRVIVKTREYWSRLRISRLEPLDQAFYRCEAANKAGIVKTTALVQVKAGKYRSNPGQSPSSRGGHRNKDDQSLSLDGDDESAFYKPFTCQEYPFEACRDYLNGKKIYIYSKNMEDIRDIDRRLRAAFMVISNSSQVSDECKEYAARAACYHSYQICGNNGMASTSSIPIRQICREDCERLEEEICPQEYETARSQNLIGRNKDQILPNCRDLPNVETCLPILDKHKVHSNGGSSCYVGNGKTYRGATSTTKSGRPCLAWSEASERHPLFAPAKYPELRNHNHCRNPGGKKPQPWCFTSDGVEEYCDVPKCIPNNGDNRSIDYGMMNIPSEYMPYVLLTAGILGLLLLVLLIGVLCYCVKSRRKRNGKSTTKTTTGSGQVGCGPPSAAVGASRPSMNGHHHHHTRNQHYYHGLMSNGVRKPNGQQMELYSLLSPSTGVGTSPAQGQSSSLIDGPPEIPPANIRYVEVMGEGQFGKLWRGELVGYTTGTTTSSSDECGDIKTTQVALKTLTNDPTVRGRQEFQHECTLKGKLKHQNIVELIGVSCMSSSTTTNNACMIFQFMMHGDLNAFLLLRSPCSMESIDNQRILLDHNDFLHIAVQISTGMEYLSSKRYIHKDLSSRNCFIFDRLTIKIADFGIHRDAYASDYYRYESENGQSVLLPIRWMSPESIHYGQYSESSDVWSFGVTLWEMYSYGTQPYYGYSNSEVIDMIISQRCLPPRPDKCPSQMYSLMIECWHECPSRRPSFTQLHTRLRTLSMITTASAHSTHSVTTGLTAASSPDYGPPPSTVHRRDNSLDSSRCSTDRESDSDNDIGRIGGTTTSD